jgi:hypothetical protein
MLAEVDVEREGVDVFEYAAFAEVGGEAIIGAAGDVGSVGGDRKGRRGFGLCFDGEGWVGRISFFSSGVELDLSGLNRHLTGGAGAPPPTGRSSSQCLAWFRGESVCAANPPG